MNTSDILSVAREALTVVLWVALPTVVAAAVVSLLIAVAQTVTQLQDQSIGQAARLITVPLMLLVTGSWAGREVMQFAERALQLLGMGP